LNGREFHQGLDFSATLLQVKSIAQVTTTVDAVGTDQYAGTYVRLFDGEVYYTYQHLESYSVSEGALVAPGQVIGVSGNTGYGTGYHLHITTSTNEHLYPDSVSERNDYFDPRAYID
jgi:murein DD-endopeptidase MepM/ murein hydrolase activator NlpD